MATETEAVFTELLAELGPNTDDWSSRLSGPGDEQSLLEAHKWLLSILQVATDTQVWADAAHPRFVDIVGPTRSGVGTTPTPSTASLPVDPTRTYRVEVTPGDAVYLSLTVYGGPDDGHYSERIVGSLNSHAGPTRAGRRPSGWCSRPTTPDRVRLDQARARRRGHHHP